MNRLLLCLCLLSCNYQPDLSPVEIEDEIFVIGEVRPNKIQLIDAVFPNKQLAINAQRRWTDDSVWELKILTYSLIDIEGD